MIMEDKVRMLLSRMMALCSKREYCEADIRRKLSAALEAETGIAADAASVLRSADMIVDTLKREKFLDDARYAKVFARDKSGISGWGRLKIRHALAAKGIDREVIAEALEDMDQEKGLMKLEKTMLAKAASLKGDPQRKFKLLRFALGRGYEYGEIRGLTDSVLRASDAADEED